MFSDTILQMRLTTVFSYPMSAYVVTHLPQEEDS